MQDIKDANPSPKQKQKRNRKKIYECKNGCGYLYDSTQGTNKKKRDAYDHHRNQSCPKIKRVFCSILCTRGGKLLTFKGII